MANVIKLRRSAVSGNVPTTGQLELGEMAINTADGICYIKRNDGTGDEIVRVGGSSTLSGTKYRFETSTANNPGSGKMHFNATFGTDYSSVTEIYLNNVDKAGQDLSNLFSAFLGDTYRVYVQKESDASKAVLFQVTGAPTVGASVTTIPVSFVQDTSSALTGGKDCAVLFSNDPSASLALTGLSDVSAPGPLDGEVLTWVNANNQWEPVPGVNPTTVTTFSAVVQTTERAITAGAFDLATGNHWTCGAITVPAPTNATAGTSGLIRITAGPVVWNAVFKFPGGTAPTIASFPAIIPFYVESSSVILMGNVAEGIA